LTARAFLFIETQYDNLGDALINRELLRHMARHARVTAGISRAQPSFLGMIGDDFLSTLDLDRTRGRSRFLLRVLQYRLKGDCCYVFLSPGGWIGDLDGRLNLRSWFHTLLYYLLRASGAKIVQLGVSYEDLGPKLKLQLRARSAALYRHFVRDSQSAQTAKSLDVRIDGICPDLAFTAFSAPFASDPRPAVSFSFRADQYRAQIDDIKRFLELYMRTHPAAWAVYFITQVEKDQETNSRLAAWFRQRFSRDAIHETGCRSIEETRRLYRRSGVVVSNRLHALLLAGSVGNAMIAAPIGLHNKKIAALFSDIGLANNVFGPEFAASADGLERLAQARSTRTEARAEQRNIEAVFENLFSTPKGHR